MYNIPRTINNCNTTVNSGTYTRKLSSTTSSCNTCIDNTECCEANANAIQTNTNAIQTNTNAIQTNANAIQTNANAIQTNANAIQTNANAIQTNANAIQTNSTLIQDASAHLAIVDASINYLVSITDISALTAIVYDISENVYDNSRSILEINQEVDDLSGVVKDLSASVYDLSGEIFSMPSVVADLSAVVLDLSGDFNSGFSDLSAVVLDLSGDFNSGFSDLSAVVLDLSGDFNSGFSDLSAVVLDLSGDFNTQIQNYLPLTLPSDKTIDLSGNNLFFQLDKNYKEKGLHIYGEASFNEYNFISLSAWQNRKKPDNLPNPNFIISGNDSNYSGNIYFKLAKSARYIHTDSNEYPYDPTTRLLLDDDGPIKLYDQNNNQMASFTPSSNTINKFTLFNESINVVGNVNTSDGLLLPTTAFPSSTDNKLYRGGDDLYWINNKLSVWDTSGTSLVLDSSYTELIIPGSTTSFGIDKVNKEAILFTDLSNIKLNVQGNNALTITDSGVDLSGAVNFANALTAEKGLVFSAHTPQITTSTLYTPNSNDLYFNGSKLAFIGDVNNVSSVVSDLSSNHNTLNTAFIDLSGDVNTSITSLTNVVDDLSSVVLDLSSNHNTLNTAFIDLSGDVNTGFTNVNTSITSLTNVVDDLSSVVLDLSSNHNTLNTAFIDLSGRLATNTTNISTNTTNIATKVSKSGDTMSGPLDFVVGSYGGRVTTTNYGLSLQTDNGSNRNYNEKIRILDTATNLYTATYHNQDLIMNVAGKGIIYDNYNSTSTKLYYDKPNTSLKFGNLNISNFDTRITTNANSITSLTNVVDDLSSVVLDLSSNHNTLNTEFIDLSGRLATNTTNISTNTTNIATKVSKSGDTMTGALTISGDTYKGILSNDAYGFKISTSNGGSTDTKLLMGQYNINTYRPIYSQEDILLTGGTSKGLIFGNSVDITDSKLTYDGSLKFGNLNISNFDTSINNLITDVNNLNTNVNTKVSKTGDTMTGNLHIENSVGQLSIGNTSGVGRTLYIKEDNGMARFYNGSVEFMRFIDNNSPLFLNIDSVHKKGVCIGSGKIQTNDIPLQVNGYASGYINSHGWVGNANDGSGLSGSTNVNTSILTSHDILSVGGTVRAISDRRIKTNIVDASNSLEVMRKIPLRNYEYIDKIQRGANSVKGWIAQEIREHLPQAVRLMTDYIPNVMLVGEITNNILTTSEPFDVSNTNVKIMDPSNNNYFINLDNKLNVSSGSKYEISFIGETNSQTQNYQGPCFVYGESVDDFHVIDKAYMTTLLYGAVSELDENLTSEVNRLTLKTNGYETEKNILVNKVYNLEQDNENLKAENALLKQQILSIEHRLSAIEASA
jgi:hypothetical protein